MKIEKKKKRGERRNEKGKFRNGNPKMPNTRLWNTDKFFALRAGTNKKKFKKKMMKIRREPVVSRFDIFVPFYWPTISFFLKKRNKNEKNVKVFVLQVIHQLSVRMSRLKTFL